MQELPENLRSALKDIFENLDKDTKDAMIKRSMLDAKILYEKIGQRLATNHCTFEDVIKHSKALELFNSKQRLQIVLKIHAEIKQKLTSDPKLELAIKIFERREFMWLLAHNINDIHKIPQELAFTLLVRSYAHTHGFRFTEIIQHPPAQKYFESGRLLRAKIIYLSLKDGAANPQEQQKAEVDLDKALDDEIKRLAQLHAQRGAQGLITQANVKPLLDDPEKMKAAVRKIMRDEHPDKNAEANNDRFHAAAEIKNLMDKGVLEDYLVELERLREQSDKKNAAAPSPHGPR